MKNNTVKITFGAMMTALAVSFMLLSYFPYLTYGIPAVAGLFIMAVVIELNCKWAFISFLASAVLIFLTAEKESMLIYVAFMGYYPIVKALLERIRKPIIEWIIKIFIFNTAVLSVYFVFAGLVNIKIEDMGELGKWGAVVLLLAGNVVFPLYDIAVSRMASLYMIMIRPKLNKIFK